MLVSTLYKVAKCVLINKDLKLIRHHLSYYRNRFMLEYSGNKLKIPLLRITDKKSKNIIEFNKVSNAEIKAIYLRYKGEQIFDECVIKEYLNRHF